MQNAAINMISSGGYKKETEGVTRSFSVNPNRAFGKDITTKVVNTSGAVQIPNQGKSDDCGARNGLHAGSQEREKIRKPSPSIHSNYQQPAK